VNAGEMEETHNAAAEAEKGNIKAVQTLYTISLSTKNQAVKP